MATRQCPFCGRNVFDRLLQCPFCREALPEVPVAAQPAVQEGEGQIRRGLLCVLLASVLGYFAGGYSKMALPFPIQPVVTTLLSPLLFLCGIGLSLHGYYIQHKGSHHQHRAHSN
jgi:hypothetical protein